MAKNPYTLNIGEKDFAMDLFARGKPLRFVKRQIAKIKGIPSVTPEINGQLDQALRTLNPNHDHCSDKNRRTITEKKADYAKDRKRASFNTARTLLHALENAIEKSAVDIAESAVENVDNPRQLKALIQAIELVESLGEDWTKDDKSQSRDAGNNQSTETSTNRTIEALARILQDSDRDTPDA